MCIPKPEGSDFGICLVPRPWRRDPRCVWWPQLLHCVSLWYAVSWAGGWIMSLPNTVFVWAQTPRLQNMLIFGNFFKKNTYLFVFVFECLMSECELVRNTAQHEEAGPHPVQCLWGRISVSAVVLHPGTSSLLSYLHSPPTSPEECWDHRNTQVLPELQASAKGTY